MIWMSHTLNRKIHVIAESGVKKYGEDYQDYQARRHLTVRYTKLWEDVGHGDCLIRPDPATTFITPIIVSPLPQFTRNKLTKRMGQSELLISSPYSKTLESRKHALEKQNKKYIRLG